MQKRVRTIQRPAGAALAMAAALVTVLVAGCSEVEKAMNRGGDTTCGDYLKKDDHNKRVTVTKYLQQRAGNEADPAGTAVDIAMAAIGGLCILPGKETVPIKNASGLPDMPPPAR